MERKGKLLIGSAAAVAAVGIGAGVGIASGPDDDRPLRGSDLERATAAALDHTGGGTVTETEHGDDGAAYEVEVRLPDGRRVEVRLDRDFDVLGAEGDDDGAADQDERADD